MLECHQISEHSSIGRTTYQTGLIKDYMPGVVKE